MPYGSCQVTQGPKATPKMRTVSVTVEPLWRHLPDDRECRTCQAHSFMCCCHKQWLLVAENCTLHGRGQLCRPLGVSCAGASRSRSIRCEQQQQQQQGTRYKQKLQPRCTTSSFVETNSATPSLFFDPPPKQPDNKHFTATTTSGTSATTTSGRHPTPGRVDSARGVCGGGGGGNPVLNLCTENQSFLGDSWKFLDCNGTGSMKLL